MPELSDDDINLISNEIRSQGIIYSHLAEELIDHVCCDVENEMMKGIPFEEAYQTVLKKIGLKRFQEIQQETLYAVDSKYRIMKNIMKISGIAGTIMLGFASLFKIMHWPLAGVIMTLGSLTLAFVFMPSALGVLWKETHSRKKVFMFVSAFLAAMLFIMGILFKVQHWPGAGIVLNLASITGIFLFIPSFLLNSLKNTNSRPEKLLLILAASGLILFVAGLLFKIQHWPLANIFFMSGLTILFAVVFPWYTVRTFKNETTVKAEFIFTVVGSIAVLLPSALLNLNLQRNYDQGYFISLNQQKALYHAINEKNKSLLDQYHDSSVFVTMEQLHARSGDVLGTIYELEKEIISGSQDKSGIHDLNQNMAITGENKPPTDYELLPNPFSPFPAGDLDGKDDPIRLKLDKAVEDFVNYLDPFLADRDKMELKKLDDQDGWLKVTAENKRKQSKLSALHSLALLRNRLLTAEFCALDAISKNNDNR